MSATCSYCDAIAVASSTVSVGVKPTNPKHLCTQADSRKVVVVQACILHTGRLGAP